MEKVQSLVLLFLMNLKLATGGYCTCYSRSNSSSQSVDPVNRNSLLFGLPTHAIDQGGYYYTHNGNASDMPVSQGTTEYCLGLCRQDLAASVACSDCLSNSIFDITKNCPYQKEVVAWGGDAGCVVRCASHEFTRMFESEPAMHTCNTSKVLQIYLPKFGRAFANLTRSIAERAAGRESSFYSESGMHNYFATMEVKLAGNLTIYGLGFCLPTLIPSACTACLRAAANQSQRLCYERQGASIFTPSCILRYELYRFYNSSSSVSPFPSPPPSSPNSSPLKDRGGTRRTHVIASVIPIAAVLTVIAFITCATTVQRKIKRKEVDQDGVGDCLEFTLNTIQVATNNFSALNKLGHGGFGTVYKGELRNGQQVAVKRLSFHSLRGEVEFKNEVRLLARLHHSNLIKLIGFCVEGKERLLIYELALNGSLDRFLFDSTKRDQLTWKCRYNIIKGITRGMLYLHEESQLRIIHRDLKAGNILLDEHMNPKISDFGTAKLYIEDQVSASMIVGTYGYMSPEYAKHGKISTKMDMFSFGVLLLEIVCGRRNNISKNSQHIDHLLSKVWRNWAAGNSNKLIDPVVLRTSSKTEVINRCIHIGLLCVQENAASRPTMNSAILMLEDCSQSLPPPSKPAYFMEFADDELNAQLVDQDRPAYLEPDFGKKISVLSSPYNHFFSVNGVSITQPYPEPR